MPKVLRIINRFNLGGPTYNVTYLTKYLNHGFETKLIGGVPDEGELDSMHILSSLGVVPEIIVDLKRSPNLKDDLKAYYEIKEIIKQYKPDIVHTHASKAGALGRYAALKSDVPVIVHTYHGHIFSGYFGVVKTGLYKNIERWLASKSDAIIAISPEQKTDLVDTHRICSNQKIKVIPLGFDLKRFKLAKEKYRDAIRLEYKIAEDEIAVAIIGRLVPIKNHDLFLDVIRMIGQKTSKKVKVFIVGDGLERDKLQEAAQMIRQGEQLKIVFTSWIKNIDQFNAGMDIICLTSINEGTPVSLIEAQAGGVPVVSTDVGGVRHVVDDGHTGYVVPPNNVELFAEKLLLLIEDDKKRLFMSQNGWNYVKDKFHYQRLVDNMENFYTELLEKKNETKNKI
jgi:glycosyltransferase involved in cell wall biosynthesis